MEAIIAVIPYKGCLADTRAKTVAEEAFAAAAYATLNQAKNSDFMGVVNDVKRKLGASEEMVK
jgi:hypothetical protein